MKMDLHIHTKTGSDGNLSVVEVPPQNHAIIDTSKPIEESVRQVLQKINEE